MLFSPTKQFAHNYKHLSHAKLRGKDSPFTDQSTTNLSYPVQAECIRSQEQVQEQTSGCGCPVAEPIKLLQSINRKYNSSEKYFYLEVIDDLVELLNDKEQESQTASEDKHKQNKASLHLVNRVKDLFLFDRATANLKCYLKMRNYPLVLKRQTEYFRYYKDLPKIYMGSVSKILKDHYYDHQYLLFKMVNGKTDKDETPKTQKQATKKNNDNEGKCAEKRTLKVARSSPALISSRKILKQITTSMNSVNQAQTEDSLLGLQKQLDMMLGKSCLLTNAISFQPTQLKYKRESFAKNRFLTEDVLGCSSIHSITDDDQNQDMQKNGLLGHKVPTVVTPSQMFKKQKFTIAYVDYKPSPVSKQVNRLSQQAEPSKEKSQTKLKKTRMRLSDDWAALKQTTASKSSQALTQNRKNQRWNKSELTNCYLAENNTNMNVSNSNSKKPPSCHNHSRLKTTFLEPQHHFDKKPTDKLSPSNLQASRKSLKKHIRMQSDFPQQFRPSIVGETGPVLAHRMLIMKTDSEVTRSTNWSGKGSQKINPVGGNIPEHKYKNVLNEGIQQAIKKLSLNTPKQSQLCFKKKRVEGRASSILKR